MKYVLDTNAVSALMKGDSRVVIRLGRADPDDVGVPQPVLAEIEYGIERLPRSRRRDALNDRLELLRSQVPRLPWTDGVSAAFGRVKAALERQGRRIEDFDAAIAAHALDADAVLVTADAALLARIPGLRVEDWTA